MARSEVVAIAVAVALAMPMAGFFMGRFTAPGGTDITKEIPVLREVIKPVPFIKEVIKEVPTPVDQNAVEAAVAKRRLQHESTPQGKANPEAERRTRSLSHQVLAREGAPREKDPRRGEGVFLSRRVVWPATQPGEQQPCSQYARPHASPPHDRVAHAPGLGNPRSRLVFP